MSTVGLHVGYLYASLYDVLFLDHCYLVHGQIISIFFTEEWASCSNLSRGGLKCLRGTISIVGMGIYRGAEYTANISMFSY